MTTLETYLKTPKGWLLLLGMLFFLLLANACHEAGHALGAWIGGDRRADLRRRITLNPVNHVHWFLTIVLPVATLYLSGGRMLLGGARPVLIDRSRLSRGSMLLAVLAGPLGNFLFAGFAIVVVSLCMHQEFLGLSRVDWVRSDFWRVIEWPLWYAVALGFLNLLPVPPLDGGHVVACFLPGRVQRVWYALAPLGLLLLVGGMLYLGGVFQGMGYPAPPAAENPFYRVDAMVKGWVHGMMPFWDALI